MQRRQSLSQSPYTIDPTAQHILASTLKIKTIDLVGNSVALKIKSLCLSNNALTRLENMQQFPNLEELDIRNNCIRLGSELLVLNALPRLVRVLVEGNPFLGDPLDQDVLEFLVERDTDIQILCGEDLERIRDLQQGQLKVVFLQNYIKKINCHDQILSRRGNLNSSLRSVRNEQSTNRLILNKIMPQFYTIIEDTSMKTKVKRDTIEVKREQHVSFDEAIRRKKNKQDKQVNMLMKDILMFVDQQDQDKEKSPSPSPSPSPEPNKEAEREHRDVREFREIKDLHDSGVQTDQIIEEESSDWPPVEPLDNIESFRRKLTKIRNNTTVSIDETYLETNRHKRQQQTFQSGQSKQSETPKTPVVNIFSPRESLATSRNNPMHQNSIKTETNPISTTNNPKTKPYAPAPVLISNKKQASTPTHNSTQPLIPSTSVSTFTNAQSISVHPQPLPFHRLKTGPHLLDRIKEDEQMHMVQSKLTEQQPDQHRNSGQLCEQYYAHLTKYNPTFALLYSDIASLSPEEKSVLIDALAKDHKNKIAELFMERSKVKALKSAAVECASAHEKEKYELQLQLAQALENCRLFEEASRRLQKENKRIGELIKVLGTDMMQVKQENATLKQTIKQRNKQLSNQTIQLRQQSQTLHSICCSQQIAQIIQIKHNKLLKKHYLSLVQAKADQTTKILHYKQTRQQNQNNRLVAVAWGVLKKHLLQRVLANIKGQERNYGVLKNGFSLWKDFVQQRKQLQDKGKRVRKQWMKYWVGRFLKQGAARRANKKEKKLHIFWADHHLMKQNFYKLRNHLRKSKAKTNSNISLAIKHHETSLVHRILKNMQQLTNQSKQFLERCQNEVERRKIRKFVTNLRQMWNFKIIHEQSIRQRQALGNILKRRLAQTGKREFYAIIKKQRQQLLLMETLIRAKKKQYNLKILAKNVQKSKATKQLQKKAKKLHKKMYVQRVVNNFREYFGMLNKLKHIFSRINLKSIKRSLITSKKQHKLQAKIKSSKLRQVFMNLLHNKYNEQLITLQAQQIVQQQQTKQLLQNMRSLQQMQIQAIKAQHNRHLQILQENDTHKEIHYRNTVFELENSNKELQDQLYDVKKDMEAIRNRENGFFKEKELWDQRMHMLQQGNQSLQGLNASLQGQLQNVNIKYQRILELYTQAVFQLQGKDKGLPLSPAKERDKTVEKEKRRVGVTKNIRSYTSTSSTRPKPI